MQRTLGTMALNLNDSGGLAAKHATGRTCSTCARPGVNHILKSGRMDESCTRAGTVAEGLGAVQPRGAESLSARGTLSVRKGPAAAIATLSGVRPGARTG